MFNFAFGYFVGVGSSILAAAIIIFSVKVYNRVKEIKKS
jgi:hypothetical protein